MPSSPKKTREVDEEGEDYIISDEEEAEENRETNVFILNIMDEKLPFSKQTLDLLRRYVNAFFGIPCQVQHPAKTAVSPPGQLALAEKTNRPLKQRLPRIPEHSCKSTRISHLFECLKEQKLHGGGGEGPYPDSVGILAITSGELFEDDTELQPWEPAPVERVYKFGVSRKDLQISILSLAHLTPPYEKSHTCNLRRPATDDMEFPKPHRYRMYIRNLLKAVSHFLLKLLGYPGCQNQRCLLYRQPFKADFHHMFLCRDCEIKFCETMYKEKFDAVRFFRAEQLNLDGVDFSGYLLKKQRELALSGGKLPGRKKGDPPIVAANPAMKQHYFPPKQEKVESHVPKLAEETPNLTLDPAMNTGIVVEKPNVFFYTEKRFEEMAKALTRINSRVMYLQYQMRIHQEFDRELEWLHYALKVFRQKLVERHHFLGKDDKNHLKRRSLRTLLYAVHNDTPTIEVLHRTFEEPFLKFRCLADMKDAGPHQTPVPLENMGHAWAYFNKKHSTGGVFLETAGALKGKTVGNFPKIGVNAQVSNSKKPL